MDNHSHAHNVSAQDQVQRNEDPALDAANEHVHGHLHHSAYAEQGRDVTEFSKGTTYEESNIPSQDPHHQPVHRRHLPNGSTVPAAIPDAEKGSFGRGGSEEDPRTHTLSSFYLKYRVFFHIFIWLLFTGFVDVLTSHIVRECILSAPGVTGHAFVSGSDRLTDAREAGGYQDSYCMADMTR